MGAKKDLRIYPALFFRDGDGIGVEFPDLPGCVSCAGDMETALRRASDALGGWIYFGELDGEQLPSPTPFDKVKVPAGCVLSMVPVRMDIIREEQARKSISKNVTLPAWLNKLAVEAKINFSQVLQEGLKARLGVQ